jgi:HAD superfamily hydrolase (TIGR01662 family)
LFEAERIYQTYYTKISSRIAKLYPGVPETLDLLRRWGYDLAIATNENRRNLDRLLSLTGIASFFSNTVCENEVANTKPDPEMARSIMTDLNRSSNQTLIVGDSILDIQMGQAVGGFTCGAAFGGYSEKKLAASNPNWIIGEFRELPNLLQIPCFELNER